MCVGFWREGTVLVLGNEYLTSIPGLFGPNNLDVALNWTSSLVVCREILDVDTEALFSMTVDVFVLGGVDLGGTNEFGFEALLDFRPDDGHAFVDILFLQLVEVAFQHLGCEFLGVLLEEAGLYLILNRMNIPLMARHLILKVLFVRIEFVVLGPQEHFVEHFVHFVVDFLDGEVAALFLLGPRDVDEPVVVDEFVHDTSLIRHGCLPSIELLSQHLLLHHVALVVTLLVVVVLWTQNRHVRLLLDPVCAAAFGRRLGLEGVDCLGGVWEVLR